jgi:hypothetical protein
MHHVMLDSTDSEKTIMLSNNMSGREYTAIEAITSVLEEEEHGRGRLEDITASLATLIKTVALMFDKLNKFDQVKILNEVHYAGWHIE